MITEGFNGDRDDVHDGVMIVLPKNLIIRTVFCAFELDETYESENESK